jgi:DNA-binding transcriptional ArsR family regulator
MRYYTKLRAPFCEMKNDEKMKADDTETSAATTELDADEIFKALAHPARRQILVWLKEPEKHFEAQLLPFDNGVCAGRIFARTELSHSTVSAHLACLQRAGLVTTTKVGQWIFYQRNEALIEAFQTQLRAAL